MNTCKDCKYYKADWGMWCVNGWSKDGSTGWCRYEPAHIATRGNDECSHFDSGGKNNNDLYAIE